MTGRDAIAFHIVTGFLGAGKTTLINRLLRAPELADALVIVNEWGEIGLDHLLYERLTGDAILINSGCVCCALRGDLVETLRDVLARREFGRAAGFRPHRARDDGARRARADPARALRRPATCRRGSRSPA